MRLFLSSCLFGDHRDRLVEMAGPGARVALIANALDNFPELRRDYLANTVCPLFRACELRCEEFDLRRYFADPQALAADLGAFDVLWAIGGNSFLLRAAMRLSGFDRLIIPLLKSSSIIYGGWSAGAVVAGRDLYGIERVDDPLATAPGYPTGEAIVEGLRLVDGTVVPHFQSAHPESGAATASVPFITASGRNVIALRDGEVMIRDGEHIEVLPPR